MAIESPDHDFKDFGFFYHINKYKRTETYRPTRTHVFKLQRFAHHRAYSQVHSTPLCGAEMTRFTQWERNHVPRPQDAEPTSFCRPCLRALKAQSDDLKAKAFAVATLHRIRTRNGTNKET